MSIYSAQFLAMLCAVFGNCISQIVYFRKVSDRSLIRSLFFGFCFGAVLFGFVEFYLFYLLNSVINAEWVSLIFVNVSVYFCLSFCYFHFLHIGEASLRIRILMEVLSCRQGMDKAKMLEKYNTDKIIEARLSRLLQGRQIVLSNDRYFIGRSYLLGIARGFQILKVILLRKKVSEFDPS